MWNVQLTGSDVCGYFCLLAPTYVEFSVCWLRCMWIVLVTDSDVCVMFCLLAQMYV